MIADSLHRAIRYLRLSITSACPMKCVYCRPATFTHDQAGSVLSADEIETLVSHLVSHYGIGKIRITGGEPTARPDLIDILHRLSAIPNVQELTMTTNGLTLARQARQFVHAGLTRVNISLDSLDARRFHRITGIDGLHHVLDGIEAALSAGLTPVKLNAVVVRGENDRQLPELLSFSAERGIEIRFIELMPMGPLADRWAERFVPEAEMRRTLECVVDAWKSLPHGSDSARRYQVCLSSGEIARVGFITAMSCPFCANCDRIRIAADGSFYPCLMDRPAGSILPALRPVFDPMALDDILRRGLFSKAPEHPSTGKAIMTTIGG